MGCESSTPQGIVQLGSSKYSPQKNQSKHDDAEHEFDISTKYMTSGKGISSLNYPNNPDTLYKSNKKPKIGFCGKN